MWSPAHASLGEEKKNGQDLQDCRGRFMEEI